MSQFKAYVNGVLTDLDNIFEPRSAGGPIYPSDVKYAELTVDLRQRYWPLSASGTIYPYSVHFENSTTDIRQFFAAYGTTSIAPPTNLVHNCVTHILTFTPSTAPGATHTVQRSNNNSTWTTVSTNAVSPIAIPGYPTGATYVRINATDGFVTTNWYSANICYLSAPLTLTLDCANRTLGWTADPNADAYIVSTGASSGGPWTTLTTTSGLSASLPLLNSGQTWYRVAPTSGGISTYTPTVSPSYCTLPTPTTTITTTTTTSISATHNNISGATLYEMQYSINGTSGWTAFIPATWASVEEKTVGGLVSPSTRYFKTRSYYAGSWGDWSPIVSGTTVSLAPPNITNVKATDYTTDNNARTDGVNVTWTPLSAALVDYYVIYRSTTISGTYSYVGQTVNYSTTGYLDTSAPAGTDYYYKVIGYKSTFYGSLLTATPDFGQRAYNFPAYTPSVNATDNLYVSRTRVTWTIPAVLNSAIHTKFILVYRNSVLVATLNYGTTYWDDDNLTYGTNYSYTVRLQDKYVSLGNYTAYSPADNGIQLRDLTIVSPPVLAVAGQTTTAVSLSWNGVDGASSYHIYRSTNATPVYFSQTNGLSFVDYWGTAGTNYYYWVRAINGSGAIDYTPPALGAPGSGTSYSNAVIGTKLINYLAIEYAGPIRSALGSGPGSLPSVYFVNNYGVIQTSQSWPVTNIGAITNTTSTWNRPLSEYEYTNITDNRQYRMTGWVGFTGGANKNVGHVISARSDGYARVYVASRFAMFASPTLDPPVGIRYYSLPLRYDYIERTGPTTFNVNGVIRTVAVGSSIAGTSMGLRPDYVSPEYNPGEYGNSYYSVFINYSENIWFLRMIGFASDWIYTMQVDGFSDIAISGVQPNLNYSTMLKSFFYVELGNLGGGTICYDIEPQLTGTYYIAYRRNNGGQINSPAVGLLPGQGGYINIWMGWESTYIIYIIPTGLTYTSAIASFTVVTPPAPVIEGGGN